MDLMDVTESLRRDRKVNSRDKKHQLRRIENLEDELAEMRLFVAVLLQHLLQKGIATPQELLALKEKLDLADGDCDGRLNAKIDSNGDPIPTEPKPEPQSNLDALNVIWEDE